MAGRACPGASVKMQGTTACPHCDTRFKITQAQVEAHHGMVRCGHCLQAFDTHTNFAPDQLDLQLEMPILDKFAAPSKGQKGFQNAELQAPVSPDPASQAPEFQSSDSKVRDSQFTRESPVAVLKPMTLAEQVVILPDDDGSEFQAKRRSWPWAIAAFLLMLILVAQAAYWFRVDLAARLPVLKPALLNYCQILKCAMPLPQHTDLIDIESSELQADPANENHITLNTLLRNRAAYAQAFPNLELTLNDSQDQPVARHIFTPADYLPPSESPALGLLSNHELGLKLHLDTANLKPSGYRLVLLPNS
jgi:predicted Zn finger-like uncharacterized protein